MGIEIEGQREIIDTYGNDTEQREEAPMRYGG